LRRKQLRQRRTRQHTLRRVPILQDRAPLRRRQYLQPTNRDLGRRNRCLQQTNKPPRQNLNACPLEQVAGIFHHPADPTRPAIRTDTSTFPPAPATASTRALSPSSSSCAGALFCNANITWNSGWCANERAGLSASTSRSNGSS